MAGATGLQARAVTRHLLRDGWQVAGTAPDFTDEDEVRWGMNVAEAAHAAGIGHFVRTSVAEADR